MKYSGSPLRLQAPLFLLCTLGFLFQSCWFDPPEFEEKETLVEILPDFEGAMAFIYQNDVYILLPSFPRVKQLTFTPTEIKYHIALSYDYTKLAYVNEQGVPQIIDSTGQKIETASPSGFVKDLGWSNDDQTLYMLVGNQIEFHGTSLSLPNIAVSDQEFEAFSFHMAQNGNYVYVYDEKAGVPNSGGSFKKIGIVNGGGYEERIVPQYRTSRPFRYGRISSDGSRIVESRVNPSSGIISSDLLLFTQSSSGETEEWEYFNGKGIAIGKDGTQLIYGFDFSTPLSTIEKYTNFYLWPATVQSEFRADQLSFFTQNSERVFSDWKP